MTKNAKRRILLMTLLASVFLLHTVIVARLEKSQSQIRNVKRIEKSCRKIFFNESRLQFPEDQPNCDLILEGDREEICRWSSYHRSISDRSLIELITKNRSSIFDRYPREANSLEERLFPLAFSISVHKNVHQLERLLSLIYWPQNLYCIHVDRRADNRTKTAIRLLIDRFSSINNRSNVFLTKSESVYWAGYGVLKAVLNCMNDTIRRYGRRHGWKYFLNLSGMDFPLKTNLELVRILKLFNESNDVEFGYELQFSRYWFSYRLIFDPNGEPYTHTPDVRSIKKPAPHRLKIYKGNLAATLSRQFVEFLFNETISTDFIDWLRDTDTADEHLWSTLNFNGLTGAPGGYPIECHNENESLKYVSRFAVWRGEKDKRCSGRYVRDVCIFGVGDLHHLTDAQSRKELFVNKFYTDYQSVAFDCMEKWFRRKTTRKIADFNETYYAQLPNVVYQKIRTDRSCEIGKEKMNGGKMPEEMKRYIKGGIVDKAGRF